MTSTTPTLTDHSVSLSAPYSLVYSVFVLYIYIYLSLSHTLRLSMISSPVPRIPLLYFYIWSLSCSRNVLGSSPGSLCSTHGERDMHPTYSMLVEGDRQTSLMFKPVWKAKEEQMVWFSSSTCYIISQDFLQKDMLLNKQTSATLADQHVSKQSVRLVPVIWFGNR